MKGRLRDRGSGQPMMGVGPSEPKGVEEVGVVELRSSLFGVDEPLLDAELPL